MSKKMVFSDETLNSYGFWLKNDGCDLSEYKKNPILLWMHMRAWRGTKDEVLPLGTVQSITFNKVEQRWEAEPVFDLQDEFAAEIARKWEAGILRMCSAGIKPLAFSEEKKLLKAGQTRATVTKWLLKEISVVDIGSNPNAIALYDENDNVINLTDAGVDTEIPVPELSEITENFIDMTKIKLMDGTEMNVQEVEQLVAANANIQTLTAERDRLKQQLADREAGDKKQLTEAATALVDAAVKDGRIDATGKPAWLKFFESDHAGATAALKAIPVRKPVSAEINREAGANNELAAKSWDEIDRAGRLAELKEKFPDLYSVKFEQKFGKPLIETK